MDWNDIWNKKHVTLQDVDNFEKNFIQMKIADGYDSHGNLSVSYEGLKKELDTEIDRLRFKSIEIESIYEVACGCGPDLLYFKNNGIRKLGGCDISEGLITSAREILKLEDLSVCCADEIDTNVKYDAVVAKGVTQYLQSKDIAKKMLDLMLEKSNYTVGVLHVLDENKKNDYFDHRRKSIENYDEKYRGLNITFLTKDFFVSYAKENKVNIEIYDTYIEGYFNNDYFFDVYIYK